MRPSSRLPLTAGLALGAAMVAAACSSAAVSPSASSAVLGATAAPSAVMPVGATSITIGSSNSAALGAFLTGQNGMTLYVFTTDTADTSSCSGTCATNWPPLTAASGATITGPSGATAAFATIMRSDGTVQVTYNHMPLYYFAGDSTAGDTNGQGKGGIWFVAPLSGTLNANPPAATGTTSSGY